MQNYNPEQIMLSAVSHRTSRDVNIMKEKLILSGAALSAFTPANKNSLACNWTDKACVCNIQVEILQYVLKRQVCPVPPNTLRLCSFGYRVGGAAVSCISGKHRCTF